MQKGSSGILPEMVDPYHDYRQRALTSKCTGMTGAWGSEHSLSAPCDLT